MKPDDRPPSGPTLWSVIKSVLSAFFGVQKNAVRERDFEHGKPIHFIIVGLLMTLVFLLLLGLVVKLILNAAGVNG